MLVTRHVGGLRKRHGSRGVSLAELRRGLSRPSEQCDGHRQRLLDLTRRLQRVHALGGEYARVGLSEHAAAAMEGREAVSVG